MSFPSRAEYESLIYGLLQAYPDYLAASTLRLYSTSASFHSPNLATLIADCIQLGKTLRVE